MTRSLALAAKVLYGVAVLAVSLVVLVVLITYFESHDDSQLAVPRAAPVTVQLNGQPAAPAFRVDPTLLPSVPGRARGPG